MDDYQPYQETFPVNPSADVQFNNIQFLYIGRNESMLEGFVGCISRVEFDDIYPLKLMFQENRPGNIVGSSRECCSVLGHIAGFVIILSRSAI